MKNQFFGIFFYLLYLLAMVKPVMPIIEYYANYDYIATVLCENRDRPYLECNGKCYLEDQLSKVNHNDHDHKSTIPQINLADYPICPVDLYTYQIKDFEEVVLNNNFFEVQKTTNDFNTSLLKPPQFVS